MQVRFLSDSMKKNILTMSVSYDAETYHVLEELDPSKTPITITIEYKGDLGDGNALLMGIAKVVDKNLNKWTKEQGAKE